MSESAANRIAEGLSEALTIAKLEARVKELEAERDRLKFHYDVHEQEQARLVSEKMDQWTARLAAESRLAEVEKERDRLREALTEATEENLWGAYNCGIERSGKWIDAGMSDARMLQRQLGLEPGMHDAAMIRERIPSLARELTARAALSKEKA